MRPLVQEDHQFNKQYCVIAILFLPKVHKVEYLETGRKMLAVAKQLNDKSFYMRLRQIEPRKKHRRSTISIK